jgi:hypothetical protein
VGAEYICSGLDRSRFFIVGYNVAMLFTAASAFETLLSQVSMVLVPFLYQATPATSTPKK